MRSKIDYGIDLGTTNSAICRMDRGEIAIVKSDTLKDTMPSCVSINKKGTIKTGDGAFNTLKQDKRRATKSWQKESSNGTSSRKRFDNKFDSFAESEQPLSRVDFCLSDSIIL